MHRFIQLILMNTGSAEDQVLLAACQFIQVDIVCGSYIRECLKEHEKTEMILQIIGTWWNNITPEIIGTWWNNITPEIIGTWWNNNTPKIIGTWWNNITPEITGTWWNNITPETQVQRLWAAGNNKEKYKY